MSEGQKDRVLYRNANQKAVQPDKKATGRTPGASLNEVKFSEKVFIL